MVYLLLLFWAGLGLSSEQQYYDGSHCSSSTGNPGSRYTCRNGSENSCQAFLLYRANYRFRTISSISGLFGAETDRVLTLNSLGSDMAVLELDKDVLVPINCSCSDKFYQADVRYFIHESLPSSEIACGVFEGLVNEFVLVNENPSLENSPDVGSELLVPIKCACPSNDSSTGSETKYFLTYPFRSGDNTYKLAEKFGVTPSDVWEANHLDYRSTVYPNTTVLVPLKKEPVIFIASPDPSPLVPGFLPSVPAEKSTEAKEIRKLYIAGSVAGISLTIFTLISCGLYVKALNRLKARKFQSFSTGASSGISYLSPQTGSPTSCLSPDILAGIKYSLHNYSVEDLRRATNGFSEDSKICNRRSLYRGSIDNTEVMIQPLRFEEARRLIDAHARINHINTLNLLGVCYGGDGPRTDNSQSYVVFEYPGNGSLRDCLARRGTSLRWHVRKCIAFDIATGLHYLHHCIIPPYASLSVSSLDVFIASNWRAKLGNVAGNGTTDYLSSTTGQGIEKVWIFAFGVVLLELVSGKAVDGDVTANGKRLWDLIELPGGGVSGSGVYDGGCFERLREFIDPSLKDDYPIAEALCLAVLAEACVADDPLHRPSMDDILRVLAGMV